MTDAVSDLIDISSYAAQHPRFVQGGGGNCSVKFDGKMAVKASGFFLEEVTPDDGYVVIDLETERVAVPTKLKPSLEFRLHCLLGTYVIHTHPIAVAALVCSQEGPEAFDRLFNRKDCRWINYAAPGRELCLLIEKNLKESSPDMSAPFALFLQNHGLFVSAPQKAECMRFHEELVQKLENFFETLKSPVPEQLPNSFMTPDHAVYADTGSGELGGKAKKARQELERLVLESLTLIYNKGWTPRFLTPENVAAILGMDEEKYRQQMLKRKP